MLAESYKAKGLTPEEMTAKLVTETRCERAEAEEAIAASVAASANYGRWWGASDEAGAGERAHKASEGGSKLLAEEVPIAGLMREGVPEPAFLPSPTLGERLFYEGSLFLFAGHKKAGKSWAMTLEARDCMAAERPVVYVDNENGRELFAERLLLSGATPETVEAHFHYVPFPRGLAKPAELRPEIEAIARKFPGAFIVFDSMRSFMGRFGLDPNKDVDVDQLLGPMMGAVKNAPADGRPTVAVIDHSNRTTRSTDEYAAAGSFAKAAAVDAVYFFEKVEPFSRDVRGLVRIAVKDDRRGLLDFGRHYRVGGQGQGEPLFFEGVDASEVGTTGRIREDVREFLAERDGESFALSALRLAITGPNGDIDAAAKRFAENPRVPVFALYERGPNRAPKYGHDRERFEADGDPGLPI
jgi:hypothetical protein